VTVMALAVGDALIKKISTGFSLWQIFTLRSMVVIPVLLTILKLCFPSLKLIPTNLIWSTIRRILLTFMWVIYYIALPHVSLSIAAAGFYTLPLFITLFSAVFNKEKISYWNWGAIFLGFAGVVLILKPRAADFNFYALLPVCSAILYAFSMIITRAQCRNEDPLVLSLSLNVTMVSVGVIGTFWVLLFPVADGVSTFVGGNWSEVTLVTFGVICALAALILIGSIGTAFAYQNAPSSIISVFDFGYIAFAAIMGFILFQELPDKTALSGIGLIVAAGIVIVRSGAKNPDLGNQ